MAFSRLLMTLGTILLSLGVVLPFLMLTHVIPSTFFLNFFSSGASTLGLALGMSGLSRLTTVNKNRRE
jgi:hypothetical protein